MKDPKLTKRKKDHLCLILSHKWEIEHKIPNFLIFLFNLSHKLCTNSSSHNLAISLYPLFIRGIADKFKKENPYCPKCVDNQTQKLIDLCLEHKALRIYHVLPSTHTNTQSVPRKSKRVKRQRGQPITFYYFAKLSLAHNLSKLYFMGMHLCAEATRISSLFFWSFQYLGMKAGAKIGF